MTNTELTVKFDLNHDTTQQAPQGHLSIAGDNGKGQAFVGGLSGSERYGIVSGNTVRTEIKAAGLSVLQAGGILGEYNFQFAIFGMMQGNTETVLKGNRAEGSFHAEKVEKLTEEAICGSGAVPAFEYNGMKMTYIVEG